MDIVKKFNKEVARSNRLVSVCVSVECVIIVFAYIMEYVKKARTLAYSAGIAVAFATFAATIWVIYSRKKDSDKIKYVVGIGFPILYAVVLFTTENTLTFTYAIPVIIILSAYADAKYSMLQSVAVIVLNIIQVVYFLKIGVYDGSNTASLEIHIIIVFLITIFQALSVKMVEQNNNAREQRISEENEKTRQLLDKNLEIGDSTNSTIDELYKIVGELGESIRTTAEAMREVDLGASETAENVEAQLKLTTDITGRVDAVSSSYVKIEESIENTIKAIEGGKSNIDELVAQSEKMKENGNMVKVKLDYLNQSVKNIESVITIISDIATQTNLLSLNASIEAARAGEAGRGFAVVASEIQNMASNTQSATSDIESMIAEITAAIDDVFSVTTEMVNQLNNQENEIRVTADGFATIESETSNIGANSKELSTTIDKLADVNAKIVSSITSVSAITEKVSRHANETVASCEKNIEDVDNIMEQSEELKELASKLKQGN